jgi:hypothetical protein
MRARHARAHCVTIGRMREEKFEVTLHTQTDGQRVVALILPNMPLELIHGDKSVTAVGLSAEEAKVLARMLLEKASELD